MHGLFCGCVGLFRALADTGASLCPEQLLSSPLLPFRLLQPAGEVVDAHVLELEQVLQAPHLHLQDLGSRAEVKPRDPLPSSRPPQVPTPRTSQGSHLHSLLRGQQFLLLLGNLEDDTRVAVQHLAIPRTPGHRLPAPPGVGSSLGEAWLSSFQGPSARSPHSPAPFLPSLPPYLVR